MPFCFEPVQDRTIQADGDRGLRFREPDHGTFEEGVLLFRDVGCIDISVPERVILAQFVLDCFFVACFSKAAIRVIA